MRNLHTVSIVAVHFTTPDSTRRFPFSTFLWTLVIYGLFDDSHSDRCEVLSLCGLICISLFIGDVEHLFTCLSAVSMLPLEKCIHVHCLIKFCFFFECWIVWVLCILNINPLLDISFANIFYHSVGCLFILLMMSFTVQKLFSLISPHLFTFAFASLA